MPRPARPLSATPPARRLLPRVHRVARRLLAAGVLVWAVATLLFGLVHAAPGDPAEFLVAPGASAADVARVRAELGVDRPILVQYGRWTGRLLRGDLGESFAQRRPVARVLGDALPASVALGAASLGLSYLLGVTLGTWQAVLRARGDRRGHRADAALSTLAVVAYAAPSYWLGLGLVAVATAGAARWGVPPGWRLPSFGASDPAGLATGWAAIVDRLRHTVLPLTVLTVVGTAGVMRYTRSAVGEVLAADFVRTARAKGLAPGRVYGLHALRVALPPLVVLFALALPGVVAGSVFVENVFAWPGVGRVVVQAITGRDYPVVLGAALLYAVATVGANLAADLLLPWVDPRRRDAVANGTRDG